VPCEMLVQHSQGGHSGCAPHKHQDHCFHPLAPLMLCSKRMLQSGSGQLGVPHMDTKPPTVPEPFALKTDRRAAEHAPPPGKPDFVFTADGEGGRLTRSRATRKKAVWTGQLTQPAPFALATDVRG
jgi:hypothetical protein